MEAIGTNGVTDMFLPRAWSLEWLTAHCAARFNVAPQPLALVDLWGFDRLCELETSHIFFTNGLKDGWSAAGIMNPCLDSNIYAYGVLFCFVCGRVMSVLLTVFPLLGTTCPTARITAT